MSATKGQVGKFMFWGAVIGAVLAMIIGFAWGGWMTSSSVAKIAEEAVLQKEAEICVGQFTADPNYETNLAEIMINSYSRGDFVQKGGWDIPGAKEGNYSIRNKCADLISELKKQ